MNANITAADIGIKGVTAEGEQQTPDSAEVRKWLDEVEESRQREKEYRKEAKRVVELYEAGRKQEYQYNILYSNTETLLPALYNNVPRPVTKRRFQDEDPVGKMAATAVNRSLEYLIDNGDQEFNDFDNAMKQAVTEALVAGRGVTWFKFEAILETLANERQGEAVEDAGQGADPSDDATEGETGDSETPQQETPIPDNVKFETIVCEEVPWDRFFHGNAKKWKDVPWVGREHFMTREELERNFGAVGAQIPVVEMHSGNADTDLTVNPQTKSDDLKGLKVAQVYEIWDKDEKNVIFISPQWKAAPIKKVADPLKLSCFFPMPKPLSLVTKISSLVPVPLYAFYEEQAKELNRVTTRINRLIAALKVRGMYDATVEGIDKVMKADDNTLVAADNVAALLAQGNALEKAIWLFPLEKIIAVLQQLYLQRQQVKQVIYEITGIADIMRGSSAASETLGAQQIKNQWGTLRLKKAQKEVARYCRDCLRIMAELAVTKLSPDTLRGMTGLPYPMSQEKQQLQMQVQAAQQQYQQIVQQAQMQGKEPPPPPQLPPEVQQQLQMPSWEELLKLLQDDIQRSFRIDIETNSTVDAEATEDKQDMGELLNAISQFLNGVAPLVQNGTMPFEVAQGMLLTVVRRYRLGPDLEDSLKKMQAPQQQQGGQEQQKALEQQKAQLEQQAQQLQEQAQQVEQVRQQAKIELDQGKAKIAQEQQSAMAEIELERQKLAQEKAASLREIEWAKQKAVEEANLEIQRIQQQAELKVASREHKLQLAQSAHAENVRKLMQPSMQTPAN